MLGIHWRIARTGNDTEGQWKIRCWPAWTQQLTSIYPCHKVLSFPRKVEVWLHWIHRKRRGEIWRWEFDNMASSFEWLVLFYSSEDSYVSFSWSKTEGWRCEKGGRGWRVEAGRAMNEERYGTSGRRDGVFFKHWKCF